MSLDDLSTMEVFESCRMVDLDVPEGEELTIRKEGSATKIILDWVGYRNDKLKKVTVSACIHCVNVEIVEQFTHAKMTIFANTFHSELSLKSGTITIAWTAEGCDIMKHDRVKKTANPREWEDMVSLIQPCDFDLIALNIFYDTGKDIGCLQFDLGVFTYDTSEYVGDDLRAVKLDYNGLGKTDGEIDENENFLYSYSRRAAPERPVYEIAEYLPVDAKYIEVQYDGLRDFVISFAGYSPTNLRSLNVLNNIGVEGIESFMGDLGYLNCEVHTPGIFICPPTQAKGVVSFTHPDLCVDVRELSTGIGEIYNERGKILYAKCRDDQVVNSRVRESEKGIMYKGHSYVDWEELAETAPDLAKKIASRFGKKNAASTR